MKRSNIHFIYCAICGFAITVCGGCSVGVGYVVESSGVDLEGDVWEGSLKMPENCIEPEISPASNRIQIDWSIGHPSVEQYIATRISKECK